MTNEENVREQLEEGIREYYKGVQAAQEDEYDWLMTFLHHIENIGTSTREGSDKGVDVRKWIEDRIKQVEPSND